MHRCLQSAPRTCLSLSCCTVMLPLLWLCWAFASTVQACEMKEHARVLLCGVEWVGGWFWKQVRRISWKSALRRCMWSCGRDKAPRALFLYAARRASAHHTLHAVLLTFATATNPRASACPCTCMQRLEQIIRMKEEKIIAHLRDQPSPVSRKAKEMRIYVATDLPTVLESNPTWVASMRNISTYLLSKGYSNMTIVDLSDAKRMPGYAEFMGNSFVGAVPNLEAHLDTAIAGLATGFFVGTRGSTMSGTVSFMQSMRLNRKCRTEHPPPS